ncbi:hypothetical protein DK805_20945 [Escherichia coli]|nr:hypothetical protein [Escherichia coli]
MSEKESIAVSVIIPVHNAAGYISDTLSTVLSQTLNDIEIIIVNDCSDDNTLEIVSALAETDSRIREGANKQVISSQADSLIKISRIWADFFPANTSNQPI